MDQRQLHKKQIDYLNIILGLNNAYISRHWIADLGAAFISLTVKTASHEKYS